MNHEGHEEHETRRGGGMAESVPGVGFVLSDDLMFASRITGTARSLGLTFKPARSVAGLEDLARQETPRLVILDLANPGLSVADLLQHLRETCTPMPRVVAYGSHVDAMGLKAARDAGCDIVLPRSAFVEQLPSKLPEWLA
jgi:CheY-like chemotaxis protein